MAQRKLFAVLILFTIFFGWQCGYERTAPDELIGTWVTSTPKYADRFFKINTDTITFGTGEGNVEPYTIKKITIKKGPAETGMLYTIFYKNEEGIKHQFAFYHSPEKGGVIRLKNQTHIEWIKHR